MDLEFRVEDLESRVDDLDDLEFRGLGFSGLGRLALKVEWQASSGEVS